MPSLDWTSARPEDAPPGEMVVMASLLKLESFRRVPGFLRAALAIRRQVLRSGGAVGVALKTELPRRTFFTLSAWRDRHALDAFVRAEPHLSSMRGYRPAMADSRFVFWSISGEALPPSWSEAQRRLDEAPES